MYFENGNIKVCLEEKNGETTGIFNPKDEHEMNWVMENSGWGTVDGFVSEKTEAEDNKLTLLCKREALQLKIEKKITEKGYCETYYLSNTGNVEYFLTKENFGIKFPYQCNYSPQEDLMNQTCLNHAWCGGCVCYIYSAKLHGRPPYLVMNMLSGSIDDYSINYDISKTVNGSYYRGAFVLHPTEQIVLPNETVKYTFFYEFTDKKPEWNLPNEENAMRFYADKYTVQKNERINFTLVCNKTPENIRIYCDGETIRFEENQGIISGSISFENTGEKKIIAEVDGKTTFMHVNVIASVGEILEKRADFIVKNQQYCRKGSHLDGAYLIYDSETGSLYCDGADLLDHNCARERIGMGTLVCKSLQEHYREEAMESLKKHREFVEREIFDLETGFVYNNIERDGKQKRVFNFPWLSSYYLEWYTLTGEKQCIKNAAEILLVFFKLSEYKIPAQCIEAVRICEGLKKEHMTELEEKLKEEFLKYIDSIVKITFLTYETSWVSEIPSDLVAYQAQAYILTGNRDYLKKADGSMVELKAFMGEQPDFHLNCIPVRYWDRYWFGKYKSYGDVFPHYWSALAGWAMGWYDRAVNDTIHEREIKSNLLGNLCIYRENGFAANNYLYPYKITLYTSDENYSNGALKPGVTYGKNYDAWSNDQDWALYYAALFTM